MCHLSRWIDPKQGTRRWGALEIKLVDVAAERTDPDAALVVNSQIVQTEQRLPVPVAEDLRDLAALFVPPGERQTGDEHATTLVQRDAADRLAVFRDQRLNLPVRAAAEDATPTDIAEVEPVVLIGAGSLQQAIAGRQGFKVHTLPPFSSAAIVSRSA